MKYEHMAVPSVYSGQLCSPSRFICHDMAGIARMMSRTTLTKMPKMTKSQGRILTVEGSLGIDQEAWAVRGTGTGPSGYLWFEY